MDIWGIARLPASIRHTAHLEVAQNSDCLPKSPIITVSVLRRVEPALGVESRGFRVRVGGDKGSEVNAAEWPQAFQDGLRLTMRMDGLKQPMGLRTEKVDRVWKGYNFGSGYESGGAVLSVEFIQGGEEPAHKFIDLVGRVTYFREWHLKTFQVSQAIQRVLNALLTSHMIY